MDYGGDIHGKNYNRKLGRGEAKKKGYEVLRPTCCRGQAHSNIGEGGILAGRSPALPEPCP